MVAGCAAVFGRAPDSLGARRVPLHLPLYAPHHRRPQGRGLEERAAAGLLQLRVGHEPQASSLRLAESFLGRLHGRVRAALLDGHLDGLPPPVTGTFSTVSTFSTV